MLIVRLFTLVQPKQTNKKLLISFFSLVNGLGKQGRKEENFMSNNSYFKFAYKERPRNLWGSNSKVWPSRAAATTVIAMDFLRAGVCFSHPSDYDLVLQVHFQDAGENFICFK